MMNFRNSKKKRIFAAAIVLILCASMLLSVVMCIEKRSSYVKIATVQCKKKQEQFIDERGKL